MYVSENKINCKNIWKCVHVRVHACVIKLKNYLDGIMVHLQTKLMEVENRD